MYYIQSISTDPYYNLALEQYVFDFLDKSHSYFMLWQNSNTIVIGKHQNTAQEINSQFVKETGITVARRLSGGGAVYHDMGNLCFTFITDAEDGGSGGGGGAFDFASFCRPVVRALETMGVKAEISGRNDMTIDGKKFSGNSQYIKKGRVMHHGTIMFDSNLEIVQKALNVSKDKIESKGIKSIKSRVTNVKPYTSGEYTVDEFRDALKDFMFSENDMKTYILTDEDKATVQKLRDDVYAKWDWNYGASPAYSVKKSRRIDMCGNIELLLNVGKQGVIENVKIYGDYFGKLDSDDLEEVLKGARLEEDSLISALKDIDISQYFNNLSIDQFISILTD